MAIAHYLAMTAEEAAAGYSRPEHMAWMACHFSPYGTGLTGLPDILPENSLLILNDRTPIHRHDPDEILETLKNVISQNHCSGLLLDFQNPGIPELARLAESLIGQLPCPVAVSKIYGSERAPIFLPPVPLDTPLSDYIRPWQNQEIWLETALDCMVLQLTKDGCTVGSMTATKSEIFHTDNALHCHYQITVQKEHADFMLWRTMEDISALLEEAETLGIQTAVGLYQEFYWKET